MCRRKAEVERDRLDSQLRLLRQLVLDDQLVDEVKLSKIRTIGVSDFRQDYTCSVCAAFKIPRLHFSRYHLQETIRLKNKKLIWGSITSFAPSLTTQKHFFTLLLDVIYPCKYFVYRLISPNLLVNLYILSLPRRKYSISDK